MDLPVGMTRVAWVLSLLCFGVGLWPYLLLAMSLPRRDKVEQAYDKRILGVCAALAKKTDIEVGLIRLIALIVLFASFGTTVVVYFIAYLMLPEEGKSSASRSNPSVPPSIT